MKLHRRQFLHLSGAALAGIAMRPTAWAQSYPERAVRVIVPYAPGGPTDIIARLVALKLSDRVGKQFYVENIAGAGGNIGMGRAAQATPDGYTVLFVAPPYVINPALYEKVPFDHKDFEPVTLAVNSHRAHGPSLAACQHGQGACCADHGQSGQVQLRIARRWNAAASAGRIIPSDA